MSRFSNAAALTSFGAAALLALSANAVPLMQKNISVAHAWMVVDAVNAECGAPDRQSMTIAVVDRAGNPVLMIRADTASPHNWNQVFRKAYTARTFRRPSIVWRDDSAPGTERLGQRSWRMFFHLAVGRRSCQVTKPLVQLVSRAQWVASLLTMPARALLPPLSRASWSKGD